MKKLEVIVRGEEKTYALVSDRDYSKCVKFGVWHKHKNGYVVCYKNERDTPVYLHRFIMELRHGSIPESKLVHHKNGLSLDNTAANLVITTNSVNMRHRRAAYRQSGIPRHIQKRSTWEYRFTIHGKVYMESGFTSSEEALVACEKAKRKHGFYKITA